MSFIQKYNPISNWIQIVKINRRNELKLHAIEQVKKYLSLLDRAVREDITYEKWEGILSEAAVKSGYGTDARVFRPMPSLVGSSNHSITDRMIIGVQQINKHSNSTHIEVTARYTFVNPTAPDASHRRRQYEKAYTLIEENSRLVIDDEHTKIVRNSDDIPFSR